MSELDEKINDISNEETENAMNTDDIVDSGNLNDTSKETVVEEDASRYYTYQSSEFEGSNAQINSPKKKFFRKATATIGFAATFGIIAGICIHFTSELLKDKNEETNVSIGGNNTTLTGSQALSTTPVLDSDIKNTTVVSEVAQAVMPSVVSITETSIQSYGNYWFGYSDQEVEGSGSGIIIKEDEENLYIATNNHVISGADKIQVTFMDETTAQAKVKGAVESEDLAVIVVEKSSLSEETLKTIKVATLGKSEDVKVGESAIAIGNALGYGQSVTAGVISAVDREISVSAQDNTITISVIQTDAAINPGNSGGALLNEKGQVIGINSAKLAASDVEGMGYAIPISEALPLMTKIIEKEELSEDEQGYMGILGGTISDVQSQTYGWPKGIYISSVTEDGPAQKAGLLAGDIIVGINDMELTSMEDLSTFVKSYKVGTKISIKYKRLINGEYVDNTAEVVLEAMPEELRQSNNESQESQNQQNPQEQQQPQYIFPDYPYDFLP